MLLHPYAHSASLGLYSPSSYWLPNHEWSLCAWKDCPQILTSALGTFKVNRKGIHASNEETVKGISATLVERDWKFGFFYLKKKICLSSPTDIGLTPCSHPDSNIISGKEHKGFTVPCFVFFPPQKNPGCVINIRGPVEHLYSKVFAQDPERADFN